MPRLMVLVGFLAVELLAFGVVVGLCERSREEMLHVDWVFEELTSCSVIAGAEEVAGDETLRG